MDTRQRWDDAVRQAIGRELRRAREDQRKSLDDLGACLNPPVPPATCRSWERGERAVALGRLAEICAALNLDVGELVNRALAWAGQPRLVRCPTCGQHAELGESLSPSGVSHEA